MVDVDRELRKLSRWKKIVTVWLIIFSVEVLYGIHQNRTTKADVSELNRSERDSCTNYTELRDAVNSFHSTTRKFLLAAEAARRKSGDTIIANTYKQLADSLRTVHKDCAQKRGHHASNSH
jgi:hypothetical protein